MRVVVDIVDSLRLMSFQCLIWRRASEAPDLNTSYMLAPFPIPVNRTKSDKELTFCPSL